jgi:hypothetical protein
MKKFISFLCYLLALNFLPVWGQEPPHFGQRPYLIGGPPSAAEQPKLATFNLDFSGGTPADLIKAIEAVTGKSMNVIIPADDADTQLPPLKMNSVDLPHLFDALGVASRKTVAVKTSMGFGSGSYSYTQTQTSYGFATSDNPITDNSIWYFHTEKPILPPIISNEEVCKFYQLQPYLNHGFTVDDITTAIQTGWKMAGITSPPELNYHKETNLLIACGKVDDLDNIQKVLDSLPKTSIDKSQLVHFYDEANKVSDLQAQIDRLRQKVSTMESNSPASTEKNSGK